METYLLTIAKILVQLATFSWFVLFYIMNNELLLKLDVNYTCVLFLFLLFLILFNILMLFLLIRCKKRKETLSFQNISPVYREYTPVFLGILVISLSLKYPYENPLSFATLAVLIFILFCYSNIWLLNPLLHLSGWKIYKVNHQGFESILISKTQYKRLVGVESLTVGEISKDIYLHKENNDRMFSKNQ